MSTPKASSFLSLPSHLQSLAEVAKHLLELQQAYLGLAPKNLAKYSRVGKMERGVLVLYADNGAIAAKLRQILPTLLSKFQRSVTQISSIRVEVQARSPFTEARPQPNKRISGQGLDSLKSLQTRLEEGSLKQALEKLIQHQNEN